MIFEEYIILKFTYMELPDFQKTGPYSSGAIFTKVVRVEQMMRNGIDEIFWGQTFKNTPYSNLRAADFWKLLTSDYVAQGFFIPEKRGPHISGSP